MIERSETRTTTSFIKRLMTCGGSFSSATSIVFVCATPPPDLLISRAPTRERDASGSRVREFAPNQARPPDGVDLCTAVGGENAGRRTGESDGGSHSHGTECPLPVVMAGDPRRSDFGFEAIADRRRATAGERVMVSSCYLEAMRRAHQRITEDIETLTHHVVGVHGARRTMAKLPPYPACDR